MKIINLVSIVLCFSLCHCASVSTLQTARVLEQDQSSHAIGVGTYSSDDFIGGGKLSLPLIEYAYRRGMWDNIDVGLKVAIIGSINADLKYNLLNGEKFALATGLGLGYLNIESEAGTVKSKLTIIDLILPLYLSYDVTKMTSLYSALKYNLRTISSDTNVDGDGSLVSTSLGVKVGESSGVFLEGSLINSLDNDFSGTQFNIAYFFKL